MESKYKKALRRILDIDLDKKALRRALDIDLGIYPEEIHSPSRGYEKRTPYMNGWNDAVIAHAEEIEAIFSDLKIDTSDWPVKIESREV